MTPEERLNLKKMMGEMDYKDNTHNIRKLKHSNQIIKDVNTLQSLKKELELVKKNDPEGFLAKVHEECSFLFTNYTDLFNRLLKDELNISILNKFLVVLKMIESGDIDQQEGSVKVGKYLKELYLDSAIRKADNLNPIEEEERKEGKEISWNQYKIKNNKID